MPFSSFKFKRGGPFVSDLGCPNAESLERFPNFVPLVEPEQLGEVRYGTMSYTPADHTSSRRLGFLPVVAVKVGVQPHGIWSGTSVAGIPNKLLAELLGDVGHCLHQMILLSPGSGWHCPTRKEYRVHQWVG